MMNTIAVEAKNIIKTMRKALFSKIAKSIVVITFLVIAGAGASVNVASAQSSGSGAADIQSLQTQINALLEQLRSLQEKVKSAQTSSAVSAGGGVVIVACYDLSVNLRVGDFGKAVAELHKALEKEGFAISGDEKSGSRYGEATASAVTGLQEKYRDEILRPVGLSYGTGFTGQGTRAKLNALYGCAAQSASSGMTQEEMAALSATVPPDAPLVVAFPNGGNVLQRGSSYVMKWTMGSNAKAGVLAFYPKLWDSGYTRQFSEANFPRAIDRGDPNFTSFKWKVPENLPEGSNYIFCIDYGLMGWAGASAGVITGDCSDKTFSVGSVTTPAPSITVISPNGGEILPKGVTTQIRWAYAPLPPDQFAIDLFDSTKDRRASLKSCGIQGVVQGSTNPSEFSWSWRAGYDGSGNEIPNGNYHVFVYNCGSVNDVGDYSNAPFSIVSVTGSNLPPVMSGVSGPTSLTAGQTGTWTITASDPENGTLSYRAVWGDEVSASASTLQMQFPSSQTAQSATFTHAYSQAGTYTPTFTVTDSGGLTARTSASVNVGTTSTPFPTITLFAAKDPNPTNRSVTMVWQASAVTDATLLVECTPGSISFTTDKGNSPSCEKGGVWSWYGQTSGSIVVTPLGNANSITVPFSLTLIKNGLTQKIYVTFPASPTTTAQKIWVTYPNDGGTFYKGNPYTITWSGTYLSSVNISLHKQSVGDAVAVIAVGAQGASNGGSYKWYVPTTLQDGSDYRIWVGNADGSGTPSDFSDFPFTIASTATQLPVTVTPPTTAASIAITFPEAGDIWEQGKENPIGWSSSNVAQIKLMLMKGSQVIMTIATPPASAGSYRWTVPLTLADGTDYKIRAVDTNYATGAYDDSSIFTIGKGIRVGSSPQISASAYATLYAQVQEIQLMLQMLLQQVGP